jgi:hypothetical protein
MDALIPFVAVLIPFVAVLIPFVAVLIPFVAVLSKATPFGDAVEACKVATRCL